MPFDMFPFAVVFSGSAMALGSIFVVLSRFGMRFPRHRFLLCDDRERTSRSWDGSAVKSELISEDAREGMKVRVELLAHSAVDRADLDPGV
jgi:hypothetical protein